MSHIATSEDQDAGKLFTDQLVLRSVESRDAPQIALHLSEWDVVKQTSTVPFPYDERSALTWIARVGRRHKAGREYAFAITRRDDDELVGAVAMAISSEDDGQIGEIGFWLGMPHWGQGYAREAVQALTAFGIEGLNLKRIDAVLFRDNKNSKRVLEKCGYRKDRAEVRDFPDRGGRRKVLLYSISKSEKRSK